MILSHVCNQWRETMLQCPLLWSFISTQDFCCEEWMKILLSRLWRVSPHSRPLSHPRKENDNDDTPLLTIRFRICSRQSQNRIGHQLFLLRFLIRRSSSRIRDLSADIADDGALEKVFDRAWGRKGLLTEWWWAGKEHTKWTKNLEELNISNGVPCDGVDETESNYEEWAVDIKKGEEKEEQYMSYLTFRHAPSLLFMPRVLPAPVSIFEDYYNDNDDGKTKKPESELQSRVSHLRKLSLTNCYLPERQLLHFKNVEELTVVCSQMSGRSGTALYWKNVVHSLPRLRRLSIDGALDWCAKEFDLGVPPFENLEELNVNRCSPLSAAIMLRFFTNSSGILDYQRQQKKWLRKLQITCTDVKYDEGFRELCEAVRAWFKSWNSWTYGGGGGYLYLSIGPSGMVVHNRPVKITESREAKSATDEKEPKIQLTLYSRSTLKLDLISDVLHLISSPFNEFESDATACGPFILSCEELELSVGLLDIEDDGFGRALSSLLKAFGKVKRLKKLRCVGSTTARVLLSRECGGLTLLPMLKSVYFDHVDFSDLDQVIRMISNPPSRVELIKCRNVRREWVSKLQSVGTDVLLGRGTSIVEGSEGSKKVEKERWTSDQVKILMNKWANEARSN